MHFCPPGVTPLWFSEPPLFPPPRTSTNDTQQLQLFNRASNKQPKMSQYSIQDSKNSFNTTNILNVQNYLAPVDDRPQLLTWLSPLDPNLRHCGIQERRVSNVGEWLIQTKEFRRWCGLTSEGEGDKAVLFCYGDPGVGKTFIR